MSSIRIHRLAILVALIVAQTGCQSARPNATAGGLLGGTAGGIIGAAIGQREGKTEEGALIGAIAGGVSGAAIGNQADQFEAQRRQQEYAYSQAAQQSAQAAQASAVTFSQVTEMTRSGLSDDLIINQINSAGIAQRPSTNDLIQLKSNGVSDNVIREMQSMGIRPANVAIVQPRLYPAVPVPVFPEPMSPTRVIHGPPIFAPGIPPRAGRQGYRRSGFSINF